MNKMSRSLPLSKKEFEQSLQDEKNRLILKFDNRLSGYFYSISPWKYRQLDTSTFAKLLYGIHKFMKARITIDDVCMEDYNKITSITAGSDERSQIVFVISPMKSMNLPLMYSFALDKSEEEEFISMYLMGIVIKFMYILEDKPKITDKTVIEIFGENSELKANYMLAYQELQAK